MDYTNFKADEEKQNEVSNVVPECIKQLPACDPNRSPLNEQELQNATSTLVNKQFTGLEFPKKTKFRVDPHITGQMLGLISFIPSKGAVPDKQGCFGVLKLRGNFPTIHEADKWAENIIRNYDSYSDIDYVYVGRDFPIMVDTSSYCSTTREIDIRKKIEDTVKESIRQKKEEEKREMDEIQERQKRLLSKEEENNSYDDLDFYVQLRVKKANALMMIEECEKRMKECNEVIDKTKTQIADMDANHPDYKDQYLEKYTKALEAIGTDVAKNPLIKHMKEELGK
jgi:hypothetical protein